MIFNCKDMDKSRTLSCSANSILNPVIIGHEISRRSSHAKLSRQDSQLSVKTLIESIENATKQAKTGIFFFYYDFIIFCFYAIKKCSININKKCFNFS